MLGCEDCRAGTGREEDREVMSACMRTGSKSKKKEEKIQQAAIVAVIFDSKKIKFGLYNHTAMIYNWC